MPRTRPRPHLATSNDKIRHNLSPVTRDPYWTLWLALITAPLVWWG